MPLSGTLLTIVVAVIAVGLLMLGLSITLMRKGHNIQGDVGNNPEMKKRGLKCAAQQIREEEARLTGTDAGLPGCGIADDCSCENECLSNLK